MTPMQKNHIKQLCQLNGVLIEELEVFVKAKFGKSLDQLNTREANRIIEILQEEPDEITELSE